MNKKSFKEQGYRFIDWVAEYLEEVGSFPVRPPVLPGDIRAKLPAAAPLSSEPMEKIFQDFKDIILPGMTHWQHPSWFAYFSANNSPPSVLAELLTAGMGAQCMIWETSPAAAELEETVIEWLRKLLGIPEGWEGVIQDTASTATLVSLLTAREVATDYEANMTGIKHPMAVYMSEEAHSSVEKGAKIAGFGKSYLRRIPTDHDYALLPDRLECEIKKDRENGIQPCCVVATVGTTSSSAIDPLDEIGPICRENGLWLHVDAAYAGTAAILPEKKDLLRGMSLADSFVFNPHKWMLTNFDCSAYFVKDSGALIRTFEIHPEYLKTGVDSMVKNYRDWGIQLGRRFRALKLWFVLRSYGTEGIRKIIREHLRFAQLFKEWVKKADHFELMAPVPLSLVCFRLNDGREESELNELNQRFIEKINQSGKMLLTQTTLKGKFVIRMAIGSWTTKETHLRSAWEMISETAKELISTMK